MILDEGLNLILQSFIGTPTPLSCIAIGDGESPINLLSNSLAHERFRIALTNVYREGSRIFIETYIDRFSANFSWTELGLFAGGSVDTPNSGKLVAVASISEEKTDMRTANIIWEINIDRR